MEKMARAVSLSDPRNLRQMREEGMAANPPVTSAGEGFFQGAPAGSGFGRERAMRRAVITGLGVVAPNGIGREAFWSACTAGRSGAGPVRSFDASQHPVQIAAEVPD